LGMLETMLETNKTHAAKARIKETVAVLDNTVVGLRRMIAKLSPLILQELGLVAAIRKEAKDLGRNSGVKVRVAIANNVGRLASEVETGIFRIVQESLHNVAKHAHAKNVKIQMSVKKGELHLLIEDDGVGMGLAVAQKSAA